MRRSFVLVVSIALFFGPQGALAQTAAQSVADRQAALQAQLNDIESQIAAEQGVLDQALAQHQTLQSQINLLDAEIKKTTLQIQAINLTIQQLNDGIGSDNRTLASLSTQLSNERDSLGQIIRQTQMLDDYSAVTVALSSSGVSNFFRDLDAFASIKAAMADSFDRIQKTSSSTESAKLVLENKLIEEEQLQTEAQLARQEVQAQEAQKQQILAQTKGQEAAYQKLIASNQKTAAQIRAALFTLRDSAAIPFGQALTYALAAEKATGVRAAVTLGVLKQETNLGQNVGTGFWKTDMQPTRDQPVFVYLMQALGLDPDKMPVSKKPSYGWGGAMGPGQFIPSTWVCYSGFVNINTNDCTNRAGSMPMAQFWQGPWQYVASKDRVRKLTGGSDISNPWSPQDAIMATAMLMADNGAGTQLPADERRAALKYFAGGNWNNRAYSFYGDGVMEFANQFQQQIDILNGQ